MYEIKELVLTPLLAEARFVMIWLSAPIVLIGVYELLHLFTRNKKDQVKLKDNSSETLAWIPKSDLFSLIVLIAFLIFLGFYIYLMFFKEDFAYADNLQFTLNSLIGKPFPMPIWRDSGRFWPLGLQEYNFLALIGKNFFTYQLFSVFQLLAVLLVVNQIFLKTPTWYRISTMAIVMVTPSFVISFFGLIYPERNVIFWLSFLILCCHTLTRFESINPRMYVYGAIFSVHFCLYYKETAFVLISSFASVRLLQNTLIHRSQLSRPRNLLELSKNNYVDLSFIVLSILFLILYSIEVAPHITNRYGLSPENTLSSTFLSYVNSNFLILLLVGTLIYRAIHCLLSREKPNTLWDSLALGAVLYFFAFVQLGMYQKWYTAPTDFIAVLYFSQLIYDTFLEVPRKKGRDKLAKFTTTSIVTLLVLIVINQNVQRSAYEVLLRKSIVYGNTQLAYGINEYSHQSRSFRRGLVTLFFPSSTEPGNIANFAYFLKYKNIEIYSQNLDSNFPGTSKQTMDFLEFKRNALIDNLSDGSSLKKKTFILKSPSSFQENRCFPHWQVQCFQAYIPNQGDLIVILPGIDHTQEAIDLKAQSKVIFSYRQQENFSTIEKILLAISRQDFSYMNVYILEKT